MRIKYSGADVSEVKYLFYLLAWLLWELGARLSHKESVEGHRTAIGSDKDEYVGWARASGQGESSKMRQRRSDVRTTGLRVKSSPISLLNFCYSSRR